MAGFQLWLNLPAKDKMTDARYQDIPAADIPVLKLGGAVVKVIAGAIDGARGRVDPRETAPVYLDIALAADASFATKLPPGHAAVAFVFEGSAEVGPDGGSTRLSAGQLGVLGAGEALAVRAAGQSARLLLLAAKPLGEPIARYGPFVMNTQTEIRQAIADYQAGRFEGPCARSTPAARSRCRRSPRCTRCASTTISSRFASPRELRTRNGIFTPSTSCQSM